MMQKNRVFSGSHTCQPIKKIVIHTLSVGLLLLKGLPVSDTDANGISTGGLGKGIFIVTATLEDVKPLTGKLVIE
jgi:hypothetical protein